MHTGSGGESQNFAEFARESKPARVRIENSSRIPVNSESRIHTSFFERVQGRKRVETAKFRRRSKGAEFVMKSRIRNEKNSEIDYHSK